MGAPNRDHLIPCPLSMHHLHLWLAGEVLRVDLGPGLVGQPVWLLADRLTRQQLLVHRKVTKILELTVTHPGIVM